jgi:hypothetical protein
MLSFQETGPDIVLGQVQHIECLCLKTLSDRF